MKKRAWVLFYLDSICWPDFWEAREFYRQWFFLATHPGYPETVRKAAETQTLLWGPQEFTMREACKQKGCGRASPADQHPQPQPPCLPLLHPPTPPPASNRRRLGCASSLFPQVLSPRGPSQLLAHTWSCGRRERAEGRGCRGRQDPVLRSLHFPTYPPFLSCPVLLGWGIAGGTRLDPLVPPSQEDFWPCSSWLLPFEGASPH